jgi:hypothetical protein
MLFARYCLFYVFFLPTTKVQKRRFVIFLVERFFGPFWFVLSELEFLSKAAICIFRSWILASKLQILGVFLPDFYVLQKFWHLGLIGVGFCSTTLRIYWRLELSFWLFLSRESKFCFSEFECGRIELVCRVWDRVFCVQRVWKGIFKVFLQKMTIF